FTPIDTREVLEKLVAMDVTRWHYKSDLKTWYMGPMAQDFQAAFGLGDKDTVIHGINADGVALAAIKGLNAKLEDQLAQRDQKIATLEERLAKLESAYEQAKNPALPIGAGVGLGLGLVGLPVLLGLAYRRGRNAGTKGGGR
ncbi:MAG: hypothetical protein SFY95_08935, partial [Planctomycetota bacterium]|nr:hypothetical protein [Planctomycetota bacterium]